MRVAIARAAVILGCVLTPVSALAIWVNNDVTNTDRYSENVAPLAEDDAVQAAIADRVTDSVMNGLEAQGMDAKVSEALSGVGLPGKLATAVDNGITDLVHDVVDDVVASSAFQQAWLDANRVLHQEVVKVLSGRDSPDESGTIAIFDLGGVVDVVRQKLVEAGVRPAESLPALHPTFQLFDPSLLVDARGVYRLLDWLGWLVPALTIGLIVLAIALARDRRRMVVGAAIGVATSMVFLAIVLAASRSVYLRSLPPSVSPEAATVVFDTLLRFVRDGLRAVLIGAMVVAGLGMLVGLRRQTADAI